MIELPPPDTKRWVVRRKAAVVWAVRIGMISFEEACQRYDLSVEEFLAWHRAVERHGTPGLRATKLQIYRDTEKPRFGNNEGSREIRQISSGEKKLPDQRRAIPGGGTSR